MYLDRDKEMKRLETRKYVFIYKIFFITYISFGKFDSNATWDLQHMQKLNT